MSEHIYLIKLLKYNNIKKKNTRNDKNGDNTFETMLRELRLKRVRKF